MQITTSEVLDLAADKIQEHGWGKGVSAWSGAKGGALCLEGAIAAAVGMQLGHMFQGGANLPDCPAYKAVSDYLGDRLVLAHEAIRDQQPLWFWNDQRAESAEEVIAVLRAAAAVQRAYETEDQPLPIDVAA